MHCSQTKPEGVFREMASHTISSEAVEDWTLPQYLAQGELPEATYSDAASGADSREEKIRRAVVSGILAGKVLSQKYQPALGAPKRRDRTSCFNIFFWCSKTEVFLLPGRRCGGRSAPGGRGARLLPRSSVVRHADRLVLLS
jgi:hypothetical protein